MRDSQFEGIEKIPRSFSKGCLDCELVMLDGAPGVRIITILSGR
jgi:hypothetical protein